MPQRATHPSYAILTTRTTTAFSLVELIVVMAVIGILMAFASPGLLGLASGSKLQIAEREILSKLRLARAEAIARHSSILLGIQVAGGNPQDLYRRYTILSWDPPSSTYRSSAPFFTLPEGLLFEPSRPAYTQAAPYAKRERSSTDGTYLLDQAYREELVADDGETLTLRCVDFRPSGAARTPMDQGRSLHLVLVEGELIDPSSVVYRRPSSSGDQPARWSHLSIDSLTGRVRTYRP